VSLRTKIYKKKRKAKKPVYKLYAQFHKNNIIGYEAIKGHIYTNIYLAIRLFRIYEPNGVGLYLPMRACTNEDVVRFL
jgi:hypothetical protein